MKQSVMICLSLCLFIAPLLAEPYMEAKDTDGALRLSADNTTYIDANNILMFVTNRGIIGRDLEDVFGCDAGTFYPFDGDTANVNCSNPTSTPCPLYSAALWLVGVDAATGDTLAALAEYASEFTPGPMAGGTFQTDAPEFRVYKLYSDSLAANPNTDYTEYLQFAVGQGAPIEVNGSDTIPAMIGDQMLWSVYNDADTTRHTLNSSSTNPMGVEIRQTTFALNAAGAQDDIVYLRWRVYNKGGNSFTNLYLSVWIDPDLGFASDDKSGCDTLEQLGFCYNMDNDDTQYGTAPPCIGGILLQSPAVFTGVNTDTACTFGYKVPGFINAPMSSLRVYIGGTDPADFRETYNLMHGLSQGGFPYVYNNDTLDFMYSGDPVTGTGDIVATATDQRFMLNMGPLTLAADDSTEVIAAIVMGQGADNLASITQMRANAAEAVTYYESLIQSPLAADDANPALPALLSLKQNYPNPFNPETTIEYTLARSSHATLTVYNILGEEIARPVDGFQTAGDHTCTWDGKDRNGAAVSSGIYFYKLTVEGGAETRRMILIK
ncbi:MAG: FlgD immunoglobulin-like domain containing protein [Candidatus Zixiibacteriota bacterium]